MSFNDLAKKEAAAKKAAQEKDLKSQSEGERASGAKTEPSVPKTD